MVLLKGLGFRVEGLGSKGIYKCNYLASDGPAKRGDLRRKGPLCARELRVRLIRLETCYALFGYSIRASRTKMKF